MGEAASQTVPKGFNQRRGYNGARWRRSKQDPSNTKPGYAFLTGIAIHLGPDSTISKDDPQRIDTPWGLALLKVRIVIDIAVYDTHLGSPRVGDPRHARP